MPGCRPPSPTCWPPCDWNGSTPPSSSANSFPPPTTTSSAATSAPGADGRQSTRRGRPPHSVHTYFLRPGDASRPVDFEVVELQEGRTFSARRVTARQDGPVLLEAMSSFKSPAEAVRRRVPTAHARSPRAGVPALVPPHFTESERRRRASGSACAGSSAARRRRPVATRPVAALVASRRRRARRPDAARVPGGLSVGRDAHRTRVRGAAGSGASVQRDHSVWFHGPADLSDWLLYDQSSPSSADCLALAAGTMFNRNGDLVCTVKQEMYFPPARH